MVKSNVLLRSICKRAILLNFILLAIISTSLTNAAVRTGGRDGVLEHLQVQLDQMVGENRGADNQQVAACHINSKDLLSVTETTARAVLQGICNPRK